MATRREIADSVRLSCILAVQSTVICLANVEEGTRFAKRGESAELASLCGAMRDTQRSCYLKRRPILEGALFDNIPQYSSGSPSTACRTARLRSSRRSELSGLSSGATNSAISSGFPS